MQPTQVTQTPTETPSWLRAFTKFVAFSTLFLIFAGAMVTSTGTGLSVPDWPLSYGMLMPPMVGGIFYEHGHRMIAATVGFLVVIQAIWLQRREPKRFVRLLGWWSLGAVILQGLLGGLTVKLLLPESVSISHAALAEIFFCLNVSIAFFTSRWFHRHRDAGISEVPARLATALAVVAYVQIILGATMRHLHAGLAIPDFPLSFGKLIPEITSLPIAANFAHRAGAVVVTALIIAFAIKAPRLLRPIAFALVAVVFVQIYLGARVVWDASQNLRLYHSMVGEDAVRYATVTSFHVMTGAFTLALSVISALSSRTIAERQMHLSGDEVPA